jgi:hypothetical protein
MGSRNVNKYELLCADSEWVDRCFWPKVDKTDSCWLWRGYVRPDGYGRITRRYGQIVGAFYAHVVSYVLMRGPVPDDLTLDHLCRTRGCVNPAHLEAIPLRDNILRGISPTAVSMRTGLCKRGHDLSVHGYPGKRGRQCRVCGRLQDASAGTSRRYYAAHREAILAKHAARYASRKASA